MDRVEMQNLKKSTESKIVLLLKNFEDETGLLVSDVSVFIEKIVQHSNNVTEITVDIAAKL